MVLLLIMDAKDVINSVQQTIKKCEEKDAADNKTRKLSWDADRDFYKENEDTYMPWIGSVCHGKMYTTTHEELLEIFKNKPKDI